MSIEDFPENEAFKSPEEEKTPEENTGSKSEKKQLPPDYFSRAQSFKEVFDMLDELGGIQGSEEYYTAEEQKGEIEKKRRTGMGAITRAGGLRAKIHELLDNERTKK